MRIRRPKLFPHRRYLANCKVVLFSRYLETRKSDVDVRQLSPNICARGARRTRTSSCDTPSMLCKSPVLLDCHRASLSLIQLATEILQNLTSISFFFLLYYRKIDSKLAETTWVHKIFGGRLRSRVTCQHSHHSDTFDRILDLSLDIQRASTLKEALRSFVATDLLKGSDQYKCEK